MTGIIDFSTACPWQLYTFAFLHLIGGIFMYFINICGFVFPTTSGSCSDSEVVMARMVALCLLYVGVIFGVLTHHVKDSTGKVTRLSNIALNGAAALLVSVIFAGNKDHYGLETSWMHIGDMLAMLVLVGILVARVSEPDAVWANKNPFGEGHGVNCKSLLFLFTVLTLVKVLLMSDFFNPSFFLADGVEVTKLAHYLWNLTTVLVLEITLGLFFSLMYDDSNSHELMIITVVIMSGIAILSLLGISEYLSDQYQMGSTTMLIRVGVGLGLCAIAIAGGRMGRKRDGYETVSTTTT